MFTGQPARTAFGRPMAVSALLHAGLLLLLLGWGGPPGSPINTAHFVSVSLVTPGASSASPGEPAAVTRRRVPAREDSQSTALKKQDEVTAPASEEGPAEEIQTSRVPVPEVLPPVEPSLGVTETETTPEPSSYGEPAGPAFVSVEPEPASRARGRGDEGDATSEPGDVTESTTASFSSPEGDGRLALVARIQETIEAALIYPPLARKRGLQGTVLAGFRVDGEGRPLDVQVLRSSGHGVLDRAVVSTIRRAWPYPPVPDVIEVPVRFRLVSGEARAAP